MAGRFQKLNETAVQGIRERLGRGEKPAQIAEAYGVSPAMIYAIKKGTKRQGVHRVLLRSGGELTFHLSANFLALSEEDQQFINGLLQHIRNYEAQKEEGGAVGRGPGCLGDGGSPAFLRRG